MPQIVAALYQFVPLPDAATLAPALERVCHDLDLTGTLLVAREGLNGTVAGSTANIATFLTALNGPDLFGGRLDRLECKLSTAEAPPFARMKVKLKPEIVTFDGGVTDPSEGAGTYVAPKDWNALLARPGVVAIDTRNRFEVALGTFDGAVDPGLTRFGDFRDFAERLDPGTEVALFCTGGIRCEKAGAYLAARGFEKIHLLQGGILKYLETMPEAESRWTGDCFVFDGRIALGPALAERPDHPPEALR